jgi:hypothetical protein
MQSNGGYFMMNNLGWGFMELNDDAPQGLLMRIIAHEMGHAGSQVDKSGVVCAKGEDQQVCAGRVERDVLNELEGRGAGRGDPQRGAGGRTQEPRAAEAVRPGSRP